MNETNTFKINFAAILREIIGYTQLKKIKPKPLF